MKKLSFTISFLIFTLILTGCNLPGETEPTQDLVSTQVALLLTESAEEILAEPTETLAPSSTEAEPTPEESPTLTATATETPTVTSDQDDPAQKLGAPAWTEGFNGSSSPWDFDSPQATFSTANGYLNLTTKANANWHSWRVYSPKLQNAYVESIIELTNCSGLDRFGLAVRASSDGQQFYFLSITCDGQWGFFRMAENVTINQIQGYQPAPALKDEINEPHRIGLWMQGSTFTIFIDGEEVGTTSDSTLTNAGYTGFLVAYAQSPGFTVKIDELKYWNLP